jgi:hypothetical protein
VYYDADGDRYLVSNAAGPPLARKNGGFVSVLAPDGGLTALDWIVGGRNGVSLDAPAGLTVSKGILYVADLGRVHRFDAASGAPRGDVVVQGAAFLGAMTAAPDGRIFVADVGLDTAGDDSRSTRPGAIYVLENRRARALTTDARLGNPGGLAWTERGLAACTFASNEVYYVGPDGARLGVTAVPAGGLDGIVALESLIAVASREAPAIFVGQLGGAFEIALPETDPPAGIGYDTRRHRLVVAYPSKNEVEAYDVAVETVY